MGGGMSFRSYRGRCLGFFDFFGGVLTVFEAQYLSTNGWLAATLSERSQRVGKFPSRGLTDNMLT